MALLKKTLSVILAAIMALSVFSVAVSAASDFTVDGEDPIATLTLGTDTLTVNPGDEIVVTAYLTTNFYAASYTIPFWYSKNIFSPVGAALAEGSPYGNYAKFAYNANLNTTLTKNQFGTKKLAWAENPVLAANGLTVNDITKDNFQNYFYYVTCGFTPNSQIGSQAEVMDNSAIVDYTFKVAEDAAPGTVGVIWLDQSYGWASNNTSGIMKIAAFKDGAGQVGTTTTACYTDVSLDAARLVFTVAGAAEPEAADYSAVDAAKAKVPADLSIYVNGAAVTAAVDAVVYDLTADRQAEVDAMAAAIEAAIAALELKSADYSAVDAAKDKVPADLSIYTNGDAVTEAIDSVIYGLDITKQAEVDAMAAAIEAAIAALTLNGADYSAVEAAKAKVPADLTIYVNGAAVTAAVEAVVYGLDVTKQAEVNAYAAAIEAAIAALELKAADYTAVDAAKDKIPEDLSIYLNGDAVTEAVDSVIYGLDITKQAEVDAMAAAIEAAIAALELKPADYTVVETAKAKIPADLSIYTDDTVATLNAAVAAVEEGLKITDQAKVNAFAAAIDTAVEGLKLKAADYAAVDAAKAKVPADLTIYVNGDAVTEAIDSVVYGLDITKQAEVDAMAAAIEAAIAALELKAADYAAVEAAKAKVPADLTIYEADKVAALNAAIEAVDYSLDITKQAIVDAYAAAIEAAIAALDGSVLPADYTAVNEAITKVPTDLTIYTDDTVAALNAAIEAVVYDLPITAQQEVIDYAAAIVAAIAALELKAADYAAVDAAKATIPTDLSIYDADKVAAVNAAVDAVVYGLDITKQAEVDAMAAAIVAAVAALNDAVLPANYAAVEAAIANVPADLTIYVNGDAVTAALEAVVYGLDITKQAEVDAMAAAIEAAIEALELKGADYTILPVVPVDLSIYTDDSVARLQALLDAVDYGLDITKQAEVDAMAAAIKEAIAALELKEADYSELDALVIPELDLYVNGDAVKGAIDAVVRGLDITKQAEVDAYVAAIKAAIANLKYKDADYAAVEAAKAKVPSDLSAYKAATVKVLEAALAAVVEGLDITKQAEVDAMAAAIEEAIAALELKPSNTNIMNIVAGDGTYDVTVDGRPEKVQFVGNDTTRTYTRYSEDVVVTSYDVEGNVTTNPGEVATEVWTITVDLPAATYSVIGRYNKVWDTVGYELVVEEAEADEPALDDAFVSAEVAVNGLEVTYTVVTGLDVAKIQITDNGTTKTLAAGYVDTEVRTWTFTKTVVKGDHNVTFAYKTDAWYTAETTVNYQAEVEAGEPETPETGIHTATVTEIVSKGEEATFVVTTSTDVSKVQLVFADGSTITLASGYEDVDGVRTWTYAKAFVVGEYSVKVMAKYGTAWVDTEIVLDFIVAEGLIDGGDADEGGDSEDWGDLFG